MLFSDYLYAKNLAPSSKYICIGVFGSYFGDSTNVEDPNAIIYETTFSSVANGGEGTIASQTWTYTEMGQNLSDGSGFTRGGYKLACRAIAVSGDENEDGIIDEYDGYLTFDLGDTLDLGPDTGDNMMIAPFIALTVLSGLGAVLLLRRKEA